MATWTPTYVNQLIVGLVAVLLSLKAHPWHKQEFHKLVLDKADVVSTTGGGLATFPQIPVLTPRHAPYSMLIPSPF